MKTKTPWFTALLFAVLLAGGNLSAQTLNKINVTTLKDCYMKQDGKMFALKDGQLSRMKKATVLANGTKIKRNGTCILPDKTKIKMTEGNCIDLKGTIADCALMDKSKTVTSN